MLNAEIARKGEDFHTLALAFERLERTLAASIDRLIRSLDRRRR